MTILGTSELTNIIVALIGMAAITLGAVIAVSIPLWASAAHSKKTSEVAQSTHDRLGVPNGGGTLVGEVNLLRAEVRGIATTQDVILGQVGNLTHRQDQIVDGVTEALQGDSFEAVRDGITEALQRDD